MKLACVSFYKNVTERNLPAGSGVFVVVDAAMGCPLGIFQENRVSKCKISIIYTECVLFIMQKGHITNINTAVSRINMVELLAMISKW